MKSNEKDRQRFNTGTIISKKISAIYFEKNRFKLLNHQDDYVFIYKSSNGKKMYMYSPNIQMIKEILFCCDSIAGNELNPHIVREIFKNLNSSLENGKFNLFLNFWIDSQGKAKFVRVTKESVSSNIVNFLKEKDSKWLSIRNYPFSTTSLDVLIKKS